MNLINIIKELFHTPKAIRKESEQEKLICLMKWGLSNR